MYYRPLYWFPATVSGRVETAEPHGTVAQLHASMGLSFMLVPYLTCQGRN